MLFRYTELFSSYRVVSMCHWCAHNSTWHLKITRWNVEHKQVIVQLALSVLPTLSSNTHSVWDGTNSFFNSLSGHSRLCYCVIGISDVSLTCCSSIFIRKVCKCFTTLTQRKLGCKKCISNSKIGRNCCQQVFCKNCVTPNIPSFALAYSPSCSFSFL